MAKGLFAGSKHPRNVVLSDEQRSFSMEDDGTPNHSFQAESINPLKAAEVNDLSESDSSVTRSSRSSSSISTSSNDSKDSSDFTGDDDEALENLTHHIKVTGEFMQQKERGSSLQHSQKVFPNPSSSSTLAVNDAPGSKKNFMPSQLLFGASKPSSSSPFSSNASHSSLHNVGNSGSPPFMTPSTKLEETLRILQEELQPTMAFDSTDLSVLDAESVVDAAEESAVVMDQLVARKAPPPPPAEDAKKLRRLEPVDHSRIPYIKVEKVFYQYPSFTLSTPILSSGTMKKTNGSNSLSFTKFKDVKDVDNGMISNGMPVISPSLWKSILLALDGAKVRGRSPPLPLLASSVIASSSSKGTATNESVAGGSGRGEGEDDGELVKHKDEEVIFESSWDGTGLSDVVLEHLSAEGYQQPFAVQALAVPVLMSGRDLILYAKTGSGKTLGYVLPLVRHCSQQPRCGFGEGPIGLILVPTQELAVQVFSVLEKLCRVAKLRAATAYGCTSLIENIKLVKVGCDAMVATPGRLLDLLTVNHCTTFRLQRVSFVVVDEADRLFDSGFREHVEAFLKNIRPDRQLAMVSATLPRELKKDMLAHMKDPIEISVGGCLTPASNVEQHFYFFEEEVYEIDIDDEKQMRCPRLLKLLQILGEECSERGAKKSSSKDGGQPSRNVMDGKTHGLILIFTQRKEEVDELMAKLTTLGYERRIATLYSGMDPIDRQFALENFTPENQFILISTAVAERGLDIPQLELVINYALPDHVEAYVHRIGRTGRAGKRGRAISFFRHGTDDDLAPELSDALERAGQPVPEALYEVSARVRELRRDGVSNHRVGFYRGYQKGKHHKMASRQQKELLREVAKDTGLEGYLSSDDEEEEVRGRKGRLSSSDSDEDVLVKKEGIKMVSVKEDKTGDRNGALVIRSSSSFSSGTQNPGSKQRMDAEVRIANALNFARDTTAVVAAEEDNNAALSSSLGGSSASSVRFQLEYEINNLPNVVRGALQKGSRLRAIQEETSAVIVRKGIYVDPQRQRTHRLKEGDRPLYLLVIGKTPETVREARKRLDEAKEESMARIVKKSSAVGAVL